MVGGKDMNEKLQLRMRKIIKSALDDFADQQVNIASENAREAIALRVTSDIVSSFTSEVISEDQKKRDEYARAVLRHYIF